jgi:hypothetical protein
MLNSETWAGKRKKKKLSGKDNCCPFIRRKRLLPLACAKIVKSCLKERIAQKEIFYGNEKKSSRGKGVVGWDGVGCCWLGLVSGGFE